MWYGGGPGWGALATALGVATSSFKWPRQPDTILLQLATAHCRKDGLRGRVCNTTTYIVMELEPGAGQQGQGLGSDEGGVSQKVKSS